MSKRILVVEDHADNRQIIRDMLAPTDYKSRRPRVVRRRSLPSQNDGPISS
jgi:CheY-like chemotaxis protein